MLGVGFVVLLLSSISLKGYGGFLHTFVSLQVSLDRSVLNLGENPTNEDLSAANYRAAVRNSIKQMFPQVSGRRDLRKLYRLFSIGAQYQVRDHLMAHPDTLGEVVSFVFHLDDDAHSFIRAGGLGLETISGGRIDLQQAGWLGELDQQGLLATRFNSRFLTAGDSRDPELAGIRGALMGSAFTLLITLILSFPVGVATAIYLEEFAPKNRLTDIIEININNLAAVPSIIFGLLGLAVFINFFGLPRSAPLVGGLVLTLMTLPTIIIAARAALMAVPPSIREAAMGLGASRTQTEFHHVVPLALPGMLTGTIIGMARALGETAPLLMIGMVAFVVDVPTGVTDPATTLPVQIYLWADSPERAFIEKTSAAMLVLLAVLAIMNLTAVVLRNKLERRW